MTELHKRSKIMLVCSESRDWLEQCLRSIPADVVKVSDGESAISHAHRAIYDLVIIFSTGHVMDEAETVLNLKDIRASTEIIMVRDDCDDAAGLLAPGILNVRAMTLKDLSEYLGRI